MKMDVGLDTGPLYKKEALRIDAHETAGELFIRLAQMGARALIDVLTRFEEIVPVAQKDSAATWAPMLTKQDGLIDWHLDRVSIDRRVRGVTPWPGAFTFLNGKMLKVHRLTMGGSDTQRTEPGVIVGVNEAITVACGDGVVRIHELQLAGRRRLRVSDFVLGVHVEAGMKLG